MEGGRAERGNKITHEHFSKQLKVWESMAYLAQNFYSCKTTEVIRSLSRTKKPIVYCKTDVIIIKKMNKHVTKCTKHLSNPIKNAYKHQTKGDNDTTENVRGVVEAAQV